MFATLLQAAFGAAAKGTSNSSFGATIRSIARYPIKILATFFTAPVLILRVALTVKNPIRRMIAVAGLLLSILLTYLAGTFLGTIVGAIFVASHMGPLIALGLLLGSTVSVVLSVTFMLLVFNATSWFFLHMSTQEVAEHLANVSR